MLTKQIVMSIKICGIIILKINIMNKIERVKNDNYTVLSNIFIKDNNLSLKAKGLLCVIMGLPKSWNFSINGICAILKESKTSVYNTIDELKKCNYCKADNKHGEGGKFEGYDYTFYEEPFINLPYTDKPETDKPQTDNDTQLNKDIINNLDNKISNKESKKDCDDSNLVSKQVDELYDMYPTKCPKRNVSLGKSFKCKDKLKKLIKQYGYEMLKFTINKECEEKYGKSYMSNFSTFLNNLPDYGYVKSESNEASEVTDNKSNDININGVTYK